MSISKKSLANNISLPGNTENEQYQTKAAYRFWFKNVPPLNFKGRIRIDYYPYKDGYMGVYL